MDIVHGWSPGAGDAQDGGAAQRGDRRQVRLRQGRRTGLPCGHAQGMEQSVTMKIGDCDSFNVQSKIESMHIVDSNYTGQSFLVFQYTSTEILV